MVECFVLFFFFVKILGKWLENFDLIFVYFREGAELKMTGFVFSLADVLLYKNIFQGMTIYGPTIHED